MRFLVFLFLCLFLNACGGPRYEIRYRYLPSQDLPCVKSCEEKFLRCKEEIRREREKCLENSRKEALKLYQEALKAYKKELKTYRERLALYQEEISTFQEKEETLRADYQFFKKMCREKDEGYACSRAKELRKRLKKLAAERPSPPEKPVKPRIEDFLDPLTALCPEGKACEEQFQKCFLACGGALIPERICVENCQ